MSLQSERKRGAAGPLPLHSKASGERLFGGLSRRFVSRMIVSRARHDRDELAAADPLAKLDGARLQRKERVVGAHADLVAGMELGAALAHQDVAGDDDLAAELLDPEPLTGTVAAVARGAARLFVCHLEPSSAEFA